MSDFVVPDMIEPIVAWRSWDWDGQKLESHNSYTKWNPKEKLQAICTNGGDAETNDSVLGWELLHLRNLSSWFRDFTAEELASWRYENPQPTPIYANTMLAMTAAVFVTPTPVATPDPLQTPDVALPLGYTLAVGTRTVTYPPQHGIAPDETCTCGVYALGSRSASLNYAPYKTFHGEVYLWGRVIEGTSGYRAQYAYPKSIEVHDKHCMCPELEAYGVPVIDVSKRQVAITKALPAADSAVDEIGRVLWKITRVAALFVFSSIYACLVAPFLLVGVIIALTRDDDRFIGLLFRPVELMMDMAFDD